MKNLAVFMLAIFVISLKVTAQEIPWDTKKDKKITADEFKENKLTIKFNNKKSIKIKINFVPAVEETLPENGEVSYLADSNKITIAKKGIQIPDNFKLQNELSISVNEKSISFPLKINQELGKKKAQPDFTFVPPYDSLGITKLCPSCNPTSELDILYDISCNKITFPIIEKKRGYSLRMLPIDKLVRVVPTNYNPYMDSVSISVQFDDKNIEDRALFLGSFAPQQTQSKPSEDKDKEDDASTESATPGKDNEQTKSLFALNSELQEFIKYTNSLTNIDIQKLEAITSEIVRNISQKFEISMSNGNDFEKNYLEKYGTSDEPTKTILKNIASSLNKILRFNRSHILPLQIENADQSIFTFHSYKRGQKVGEFKYTFFNKGGFKIDFSSGLFATGLIDKKYTFGGSRTKIDTTHSYIPTWDSDNNVTVMKDSVTGYTTRSERQIIRGSKENFNIGLGVLLHAYTRLGKRLNGGISIGGIIDNQSTIKYTVGGSLLLGREQRLILTGGIALGKIAQLADGFKEDAWTTPGATQLTPATEPKWSSGWFVGVTYNLGTLVNR